MYNKINKSKLNRNLIKKHRAPTLDTYFPAPKLVQLLNLNNKQEKIEKWFSSFWNNRYLFYISSYKTKSYTTIYKRI